MLDQCRTTPALVTSVDGDTLQTLARPLLWDGRRLVLGAWAPRTARWRDDGLSLVGAPALALVGVAPLGLRLRLAGRRAGPRPRLPYARRPARRERVRLVRTGHRLSAPIHFAPMSAADPLGSGRPFLVAHRRSQ